MRLTKLYSFSVKLGTVRSSPLNGGHGIDRYTEQGTTFQSGMISMSSEWMYLVFRAGVRLFRAAGC